MPIERAYPVYAGLPASRCDIHHPDELTVQQACSHIIVGENYGSDVLRLPMLRFPRKDESADEMVLLPDYGPALVMVLNRSKAPLIIRPACRRAQPSHTDLKGNIHSYEAPPAPMWALGTLAGTHQWTSFAEFVWSGGYRKEWFLVRASEDWEPAAEASDG